MSTLRVRRLRISSTSSNAAASSIILALHRSTDLTAIAASLVPERHRRGWMRIFAAFFLMLNVFGQTRVPREHRHQRLYSTWLSQTLRRIALSRGSSRAAPIIIFSITIVLLSRFLSMSALQRKLYGRVRRYAIFSAIAVGSVNIWTHPTPKVAVIARQTAPNTRSFSYNTQ